MTLETEVSYRYFLTDLLSNQVISEVPFKGVSFERANRRAGAFSGQIPFLEATKGLDLYEALCLGVQGCTSCVMVLAFGAGLFGLEATTL